MHPARMGKARDRQGYSLCRSFFARYDFASVTKLDYEPKRARPNRMRVAFDNGSAAFGVLLLLGLAYLVWGVWRTLLG